MRDNWKNEKIVDVLDLIIDNRGKTPQKSEIGIKTLSAKSVKMGFIDYSQAYCISSQTFGKFMVRGIPKKGDILLTTEAPLGCVARLNRDNIATAQRLLTLRGKLDILDNDYLMYYLMSSIGQHELLSRASGSVVIGIKQSEFRKINITLPPIAEQKKIAKILSDIDDKIECNNAISKNLEEMASALYKNWFVDFEFPDSDGKPYKSSGGKFIDSERGSIPLGWSAGKVESIVKHTISGDWGKEEMSGNINTEVYCMRGADIPEVIKGNLGKMPKRFILEKNYNAKKLTNGNLVVEISGGSPTQSTGRIAMVTEHLLVRYDKPIVCTNFCRALSVNENHSHFLYYAWKKLYNENIMFGYENGTTGIKNFDINGFLENERIVLPKIDVLIRFDEQCEQVQKLVFENGTENQRLAELRDSLLPRLMSGELDVSNIELDI